MYTLGLDTIAGAKLLQLKFGAVGAFQPDQAVMHGDRRARFIRMSDGAAIIRHWGDTQPVAVPPEALSLPPPAPPAPAGANRRHSGDPRRSRPVVPREMGWLPLHQRQRRQLLRP
jgi:hypothetical protein